MEVLVQGTKGGYKILYPNQVPDIFYSFAKDVRRMDGNGAIGWRVYALSTLGNGCIFSEYIGLYDELRSFGGYVAFSAFLPSTITMAGSNIKAMLDEMVDKYCHDYATDGRIRNIQENWSFVKEISDKYQAGLNIGASSVDPSGQAGAGEAAYLFYSDDAELVRYIDHPYQEEYGNFRQVFLVDRQYETKSNNPLNAIRHDDSANLTGKIDLDNISYRLRDFFGKGKQGADIELLGNGTPLRNNDIIRSKDTIRLKYSRRFYVDESAEGRIDDYNMAKFLVVEGNNIRVKSDVVLTPMIKRLHVDVRDEKDKSLSDADIKCISDNWKKEKTVVNGTIRFEGDELGDSWTVIVKKGKLSQKRTMLPCDVQDVLRIVLRSDAPSEPRSRQNSERKYHVEFDSNKGIYSGPITVYAKPSVDIIRPQRGYIFKDWEYHPYPSNKAEGYEGYYEAVFDEMWWHRNPKKLAVVVVIILALIGGGIWLAVWLSDKDKGEYNSDQKTKEIGRISDELKKTNIYVDSIVAWHNRIDSLKPEDNDTIKPLYDSVKNVIDSIYETKKSEFDARVESAIAASEFLAHEHLKTLSDDSLRNNILCDEATRRSIDSALLRRYLCLGYCTRTDGTKKDFLNEIFEKEIDVKQYSPSLYEELNKLEGNTNKVARENVGTVLKDLKNENSIKNKTFDQIAEIIKIAYENKDKTPGQIGAIIKNTKPQEMSGGSKETATEEGTDENTKEQINDKIINDFWENINAKNSEKADYDKLFNNYTRTDDYKNFYDEMCNPEKWYVIGRLTKKDIKYINKNLGILKDKIKTLSRN